MFVRRFPRFIPYLDDRDLPVTIHNPYYGRAGFRLSPRWAIESQLLYHGAFDEKSLLYFMRLLRPGDVCVDVGASIGALTLSMAHHIGESGRVIAFEPGPVLFERLQENISLSGARNVEAHELGLSDKPQELFWWLEPVGNSVNARLSREHGEVTVRVTTLDNCAFVSALPRLDFIKIDVEGMELEVVRGGRELIERHKPTMLIETLFSGRQSDDEKIAELLKPLENGGYDFWEIDVKEQDLKSYQPDFRFIRCSYPRLPQNTLCVHETRRALVSE